MGRRGTLRFVNVEKLPSGRWRAVVRYDGHRRATSTYPTKREAGTAGATLLLAMRAEVGPTSRRPLDVADVTVGDLLAMHRARGTFSATYGADHDRVVKRLPDSIKRRKVGAVTPLHADAWWCELAADGWTPHRVKRAHTVMSSAFTQAVRWGMVRTNPLRDVPPPPVAEHEVTPPSLATVLALVEEADADPCFGAFVRLIADTGVRRGEALGVRWGDVTPGERPTVAVVRAVAYTKATGVVVKETKSGRRGRRTLVLAPSTADALARWEADQGTRLGLAAVRPGAFVFSKTGDAPRRPDWASQRWHRLTLTLGVDVGLHDLRHAVASEALERGENPVRVARRMGHSRVSTTLDIYGHLVAVD